MKYKHMVMGGEASAKLSKRNRLGLNFEIFFLLPAVVRKRNYALRRGAGKQNELGEQENKMNLESWGTKDHLHGLQLWLPPFGLFVLLKEGLGRRQGKKYIS